MSAPRRLVVPAIAFLLGCGTALVLRGEEQAPEPTHEYDVLRAEYERKSRELEGVVAENASLRALLETQSAMSRELLAPAQNTGGRGTSLERNDEADPVLESLREGDVAAAIRELADSFADGELTTLELMNLVVPHPDMIRAGINDHALPDPFREALIEALSSTDDPIGILRGVDLTGEPNQRFSSMMAALVRSTVDASAEADPRTFGAIQDLLAGNPMRGEKINLYPALAQLGSRGHAEARALAERFVRETESMFSKGITTLLDPPLYDDSGRDLRGAVIFSSQFNKGDWSHRPKTLELGDIVVSIGDVAVGSQGDFQKAVNRYQGGDGESLVPVRVYSQRPDGSYELQFRQMDPGDFRLMYGVYTLRS